MLVKANHYANVTEVTLTKVMLSSAEEPKTSDNSTGASETLSSDFALTVEMCQCPPNYAGTSCEVRTIIIISSSIIHQPKVPVT